MYSEIVQLISSVGFPIVVCGAMAWYINTTHKDLVEAFGRMADTINQNNDVITLLKELLNEKEN